MDDIQIRIQILIWLGTYRDHLPPEAVAELQKIADHSDGWLIDARKRYREALDIEES